MTRCIDTTEERRSELTQNLGLIEWRIYVTGSDTDRGRVGEFHALLYFLPQKEKGLNGGLDVGHDTAFEDLAARVFIGQSFDILK